MNLPSPHSWYPDSPNIARQEGASCDVRRQAMPETVMRTIPTPEIKIRIYQQFSNIFQYPTSKEIEGILQLWLTEKSGEEMH